MTISVRATETGPNVPQGVRKRVSSMLIASLFFLAMIVAGSDARALSSLSATAGPDPVFPGGFIDVTVSDNTPGDFGLWEFGVVFDPIVLDPVSVVFLSAFDAFDAFSTQPDTLRLYALFAADLPSDAPALDIATITFQVLPGTPSGQTDIAIGGQYYATELSPNADSYRASFTTSEALSLTTVSPSIVPLPAPVLLMLSGILMLAGLRRGRKHAL